MPGKLAVGRQGFTVRFRETAAHVKRVKIFRQGGRRERGDWNQLCAGSPQRIQILRVVKGESGVAEIADLQPRPVGQARAELAREDQGWGPEQARLQSFSNSNRPSTNSSRVARKASLSG